MKIWYGKSMTNILTTSKTLLIIIKLSAQYIDDDFTTLKTSTSIKLVLYREKNS